MRVTKPGIVAPAADTVITFEGQPVQARDGESLAAALVASGHLGLRRTRTAGDRGVFCGMGVCSECAVQVGGAGGRLACLEKVAAGLVVQRNPPVRAIGLPGLPPGAGPGTEPEKKPEETREADVLVVGAGPAGLQAAVAAAEAGARVLVVDERAEGGGQYLKQPAGLFGIDEAAIDAQYRKGRSLLREVAGLGVGLLPGTRVWGCSGPGELYAASPAVRYVLRGRALVLATGAYERAAPFPGWTLPGVMTTGAAQILLRSYLVAPGARVLVAGNGPLNFQVAAELAAARATVVALAEAAALSRPGHAVHLAGMAGAAPRYLAEGLAYMGTLARRRVPVFFGATVVEATGDGRAEVATVARLDDAGRPRPGTEKRFPVDAVCLGLGFVPSSELARLLGCEHRVAPGSGVLVTERDGHGRTSVEGVWVAGDGGEVGGAEVAQLMGFLAGLDAASSLGRALTPELKTRGEQAEVALARHRRFQRSLWRLYAAPRLVDQLATPETVVCRCEEVTLGQLTGAATPWLAGAGPLKRASRAGMGKCQGRYCSPVVMAVAARQSGQVLGPRSGFAPQVPVTPVAASVIAGGWGPPS